MKETSKGISSLLQHNSSYKPRQHIKKQRHLFADKGPSSQSYGFSNSHLWTESWTIKKAECWRIDALECGVVEDCWEFLGLRGVQTSLKEISPEYSLEGLMLKLKLQYFGHLMQRTDSFEKTLMLGKIEGRRKRGQQRMRWLDGLADSWTWVWATPSPGVGEGQGSQACCSP